MKDNINNDGSHKLVEFYHLDGFSSAETATIVFSGTNEECSEEMSHLNRINRNFECSRDYRYEIHTVDEATKVVELTNKATAHSLALFRQKVYGEPMTA